LLVNTKARQSNHDDQKGGEEPKNPANIDHFFIDFDGLQVLFLQKDVLLVIQS